MIKICIAGATGRMGRAVIRETANRDFEIVGAITSPNNLKKGKTLRELGFFDSDVKMVGPSDLSEAMEQADVYISFTSPEAELVNIPIVADRGKKIVMGTTGLTDSQKQQLKDAVSSKVPVVFAPNFAIGINLLYKIIKALKTLPEDYEVSVIEMHHSGKKDAPSGTANIISKLISEYRNYKTIIHGRSGVSTRKPEELEVLSIRAGGIPGIHKIIAAGPYEMLALEHLSFSRNVFAQGALYATEWINKQTKPGVYSLEDVLNV